MFDSQRYFLNNYRSLLLIFLVSILLTSCSSGDLLRGKAKNMIQNYKDKYPITIQIYMGGPHDNFVSRETAQKFDCIGLLGKEYLQAQNDGLLKITPIDAKIGFLSSLRCNIEPTDKGKSFVVGYNSQDPLGHRALVKGADIKVIDVTGITKPSDMFGQKYCVANYTYKLQPTPFGKVFLSKNKLDKIHMGNAEFVLYDDGWRLAGFH